MNEKPIRGAQKIGLKKKNYTEQRIEPFKYIIKN